MIVPGFTEYRKQYLETAHDLHESGFSPIFIVDLRNQGESDNEIGPPPSFEQLLERHGELDRFTRDALDTLESRDPSHDRERATRVLEELLRVPMHVAFVGDFDDYGRDVEVFLERVVAPRLGNRRAVVLGHSMGGTVVAQLINRSAFPPDRIAGCVLVTPMMRIRVLGSEGLHADLAEFLVAIQSIFQPKAPLYLRKAAIEAVDKYTRHFSDPNPLTHSPARKTESDFVRIHEGHETVGASARWYASATRSMARIVREARPATLPVLILTAGEESIVSSIRPRLWAQRLAGDSDSTTSLVRLVEVPRGRHNLLLESDDIREPVIATIVGFAREHR